MIVWLIKKKKELQIQINFSRCLDFFDDFSGGGGTAIPIAVENLSINVGGIEKRPGYLIKEDGKPDTSQIIPRDYLWLTFNIDHTTVDGAPTTRFLSLYRDRVRMGYGLDEIESKMKKAKET
jgi:pyruvate/2-oxoglutarate dehydrogenase complex dihydrolipoamide acyltransferase (E2) component